jgi:hypothetical protein
VEDAGFSNTVRAGASGLLLAVVGDVVCGVICAVAVGTVSGPLSDAVSKAAFVVRKVVGSNGAVAATAAGLAGELVSDLAAGFAPALASALTTGLAPDFGFRFGELRLELALPFEAVLGRALKSTFVWNFETGAVLEFVPVFPTLCSAAELDMDEASVALKLENADDWGNAAVEVVAAGVAAGMRIASTCIGVTTDLIALDAPLEPSLT